MSSFFCVRHLLSQLSSPSGPKGPAHPSYKYLVSHSPIQAPSQMPTGRGPVLGCCLAFLSQDGVVVEGVPHTPGMVGSFYQGCSKFLSNAAEMLTPMEQGVCGSKLNQDWGSRQKVLPKCHPLLCYPPCSPESPHRQHTQTVSATWPSLQTGFPGHFLTPPHELISPQNTRTFLSHVAPPMPSVASPAPTQTRCPSCPCSETVLFSH